MEDTMKEKMDMTKEYTVEEMTEIAKKMIKETDELMDTIKKVRELVEKEKS